MDTAYILISAGIIGFIGFIFAIFFVIAANIRIYFGKKLPENIAKIGIATLAVVQILILYPIF